MEKSQAIKASKIIRAEATKIAEEYGFCGDQLTIVAVESKNIRCYYGVEIRSDGDAYDYFYESENAVAEANQANLEKILDKTLGFESGEHYFEKRGQGILDYF